MVNWDPGSFRSPGILISILGTSGLGKPSSKKNFSKNFKDRCERSSPSLRPKKFNSTSTSTRNFKWTSHLGRGWPNPFTILVNFNTSAETEESLFVGWSSSQRRWRGPRVFLSWSPYHFLRKLRFVSLRFDRSHPELTQTFSLKRGFLLLTGNVLF